MSRWQVARADTRSEAPPLLRFDRMHVDPLLPSRGRGAEEQCFSIVEESRKSMTAFVLTQLGQDSRLPAGRWDTPDARPCGGVVHDGVVGRPGHSVTFRRLSPRARRPPLGWGWTRWCRRTPRPLRTIQTDRPQ